MLGHEKFHKLLALAAIGQISLDEEIELRRHLQDCPECEHRQSDYDFVVARQFAARSAVGLERDDLPYQPVMSNHVRDSFLARARSEGIEFSPEAQRASVAPLAPAGRSATVIALRSGIAAAALIGITAFGLHLRSGQRAEAVAKAPITTPLTRPASFAARTEIAPAAISAVASSSAATDRGIITALQRQIDDDNLQEQKTLAELQQSRAAYDAVIKQLAQQSESLAQVQASNDKLASQHAVDTSDLLAQNTRVATLTRSLEAESNDLERERQLQAASKDVRQLMGARNLHIIDVRDVTGSSPADRAFGRVFYSEGQSLIFYAFDLPKRGRNPGKYSFAAWGQSEGRPSLVRCLGTFGLDDHDQARWVLKVENPGLLTGIDSVFVTAESSVDRNESHGQKLLYAYLAGKPNHP